MSQVQNKVCMEGKSQEARERAVFVKAANQPTNVLREKTKRTHLLSKAGFRQGSPTIE